jgi:hypothetical protein
MGFGLAEFLIFHSYVAIKVWGGGVEGEWGSKVPISLHFLAQGEGQGRGLRSLPLVALHWPFPPQVDVNI